MADGLAATIEADFRHSCATWGASRGRVWLVGLTKSALYPRIRAVLLFRLAQRCWRHRLSRPIALWLQARILRASGAELHPAAAVGPGLMLAHSSGIVVGHEVTIGRDCVLFHGVTLGHDGKRPGQPVLGDRVRIFAGSAVLGPVHLGDEAIVATGAVVLGDVAAGVTVIGAPAHPIQARS